MADVTLKLVADNSQYVQRIKDAQTATQKLYDSATGGSGKLKGAIEQEEVVLKNLQKLKKQQTTENIAAYNKEIEASQKRLNEYNNIGNANDKITKSGGGLLSALKAWGAGFLTVTTLAAGFKAVIESTDTLSDKFAATLNGWKEGFKSMARAIANNDFKDFFKNVKAAIAEGQRYTETEDKIGDAERAAKMRIDDRATAIMKLRVIQNKAQQEGETAAQALKRQTDAGEEAAQLLIDNSTDLLLIAKARFDNELHNAAIHAGFQEADIERGKQLVQLYLQQEPVLMRQVEIGKEYNALKERLDQLNVPAGGTTALTARQVQANIDEKKSIEDKIAALGSEAVAYGKTARLANIVDEQRNAITSKYQAMGEADREKYNLRVLSKLDAATGKQITAEQKGNDKQLEEQKKYQELSLKLLDDYDKSNIESLTGVEKLKAQRDFGVKQIKEMRDQLALLGPITEEQYNMFQSMADNVWKAYYTELKKIAKIEAPQVVMIDLEIQTQKDLLKEVKKKLDLDPLNVDLQNQVKEINDTLSDLGKIDKTKLTKDFKEDISKALAEGYQVTERDGEDIVTKFVGGINKILTTGKDALSKYVGDIIPVTSKKKITSVWQLMGIDPEDPEGKKEIENLTKVADVTMKILDDTFKKRVEDAQRNRELLDKQVSDKQSELTQEIELNKQGFASNVDGKKRELEALQKQRELAIQKENEAIKRQRQLDAITQSSALLTASANIIKGFSAMPIIGQILAIAAIAAMFAAFVAARTQANSVTKLKSGGYGEVKGKRHYEGGEWFTDQIEVEQGEKWGVLSRPASKKHGKAFEQIVDSFNKDNPVIFNKAISILNPDYAGGRTVESYKEITNNIDRSEKIQKEINNLKTEIDNSKSKTEIKTINNQISKLKTELKEVTNQINNSTNIDNRLIKISNEVNKISNISKSEKTISNINSEIQNLNSQNNESQFNNSHFFNKSNEINNLIQQINNRIEKHNTENKKQISTISNLYQNEVNHKLNQINNEFNKTDFHTLQNEISVVNSKIEKSEINNFANKQIHEVNNQINKYNTEHITKLNTVKTIAEINKGLNQTFNKVNNISKEKFQFVKLNPEVLKQVAINEIKNNIKIDNSGSNKRLDNIHAELKNSNKKPVKEEIFETGRETIIIKGQSRRTIRNGSNR